jgi:hypothetical protein
MDVEKMMPAPFLDVAHVTDVDGRVKRKPITSTARLRVQECDSAIKVEQFVRINSVKRTATARQPAILKAGHGDGERAEQRVQ